MQGYIGLYRCLLEKPIWRLSTPEQKSILITLLLMVNHKESEWEWQGEKFKVLPGQTVTSLDKIAEACGKGITIQNVRTALARFEKLEFLTNKSTKTGRLISIENWALYQVELKQPNKEDNKDLTKTSQRPNKDLTPNNNDNNNKNDKNVIINNIYTAWNDCKIIVHKKINNDIEKAVKKVIKDYTEEEIKTSIHNYSRIINGDGYYFTHKWTLDEFLNRGLKNFLDWGVCSENYKSKEINKPFEKQKNGFHNYKGRQQSSDEFAELERKLSFDYEGE